MFWLPKRPEKMSMVNKYVNIDHKKFQEARNK